MKVHVIDIDSGNNKILPNSMIMIESLLLKSANTHNKGQWYANIFRPKKTCVSIYVGEIHFHGQNISKTFFKAAATFSL